MADFINNIYQRVIETDPLSYVADLRFPQIRQYLQDIETIQRKFTCRLSNEAEILTFIDQLNDELNNPNTGGLKLASIKSFFQCFILISAGNTLPTTTVPNLKARLSYFINGLKMVNASPKDEYKLYRVTRDLLEVARIKTTNSQSLTKRDNQLINEAWLGMKWLNRVRDQNDANIGFKYIFGAFSCGSINPDAPNLAEACCGGGSVFYSIEEDVRGTSLSLLDNNQLKRDGENIRQQLFNLLTIAKSLNISNFKLDESKIVIRPNGRATIVDFSTCIYFDPKVKPTDKTPSLDELFRADVKQVDFMFSRYGL